MDAMRVIAERRRATLARIASAAGVDPDKVSEQGVAEAVQATAEQRDELASLLYLVLFELHPVNANTSRHGRGIGGQAMTWSCLVTDPDGPTAQRLYDRAQAALQSIAKGDGGRIGRRIEQIRGEAGG